MLEDKLGVSKMLTNSQLELNITNEYYRSKVVLMQGKLEELAQVNSCAKSFLSFSHKLPQELLLEIGEQSETLFFVPMMGKGLLLNRVARPKMSACMARIIFNYEQSQRAFVDGRIKSLNEKYSPLTIGLNFSAYNDQSAYFYAAYSPCRTTGNNYGLIKIPLIADRKNEAELKELSNLVDSPLMQDFKVVKGGRTYSLETGICLDYLYGNG
ncbi:MAG TPA: hypothetical protein VHA74_01525 [Candidatus Dojkabacteria bacterium]|nr:hypothetical protein [Candidatus Dojkabacteria bacterium]